MLILGTPVHAEKIVREISWTELQSDGLLKGGTVLPPDDKTPFARLRVESSSDQPVTINIFTITEPGITALCYALKGQLRCENISQTNGQSGYLEMLNYFADGGPYFTKGLAKRGPLKALEGSCDWRFFALPFTTNDDSGQPQPKG